MFPQKSQLSGLSPHPLPRFVSVQPARKVPVKPVTILGLLLTLLGGAIILAGGGYAMYHLVSIYYNNVNDPLGQADGAEANVSHQMLIGVGVGAIGILPFLIGSVILKVSLFRRLFAKGAAKR